MVDAWYGTNIHKLLFFFLFPFSQQGNRAIIIEIPLYCQAFRLKFIIKIVHLTSAQRYFMGKRISNVVSAEKKFCIQSCIYCTVRYC